MPVVKVPGDDGSTITLLDVDGTYRASSNSVPDHENVVKSIPTWLARDDDVLICAYPKSGTHWIWEVTSMLVKEQAERIWGVKESTMLELTQQSKYDNIPSPRVLNTHMEYKHLPKDMLNRRCKILYMIRNPKDVAVSFYNHHRKLVDYEFNGSWESYISRFLRGDVDGGSWFDFTLSWENFIVQVPDYPILITYYENMKENPLKEIQKIAKFLDAPCDEAFLQRVAHLCDFENMKLDKDQLEDTGDWKDNKPEMYRKGQVGDWKNWFTVCQNDLFDRTYIERMQNSESAKHIRFSL